MSIFFKLVKCQDQNIKNLQKILSQGIFMWNIKALALTVQKLLARLKFQREWQNDRQDKNNMPPDFLSRGHKNNGTHGKVLSQGILMWNIKALTLTVQKLLAKLKFQRGGQNDRMTEWQNDRMTELQNDRQDKNNMPPDLRSRGHKKLGSQIQLEASNVRRN